MLSHLVDGLTSILNVQDLAYLFGGSIVGVFLGVLPGVGGIVLLSVLLAFLYHISIVGVLAVFLAVHAASFYAASVTSILLNTPAHPEAFAVTFDGFPMAQRGEAGRALGISATATCIGGIIGCIVLVGFFQIINYIPGIFHPPEFVALVLLALLLVGTLGTDKVSKAVISAGIGIMLGSIGSDPVTGVYRYTFNAVGLLGGISLVSLALGLFAVPQMVLVFGTATTIARQDMTGREVQGAKAVHLERGFGKQVFQGVGDALRHWVAMIRGALIGSICGIIPGIGGFAANFMSYGIAQQMSKNRELFGTGIPEGILAPESSSLSKEAGGLVPVVGLGIPGGVGGALFLAALSIKGIKVGYGFTKLYPTLTYEIVWVILFGGVIGTVIGLLLSPILARVTRIPGPLLVPFIMVMASVGPFVSDVVFFSVVEALCFCFVGFFLRRLRYSSAAFVIGLVLGPTLEQNISLTHQIFPGWSFISARPLADVLFAIVIGVLVLKTLQQRSDAKKANPPITEEDPIAREQIIAERFKRDHPYPQLSFIVSWSLFAFSLVWIVYGLIKYQLNSAFFPVLGGAMAGFGALWRIPPDTLVFIRSLRVRRELRSMPSGAPARSVIEQTDRRGGERALPPIVEKSWGWNGQFTREFFALSIYSVFVGAMYVFGFLWSVPAFVVLYGLFGARRVMPRLRSRIIYSVLATGALWGATYEMLNLLHITFTPIVNL